MNTRGFQGKFCGNKVVLHSPPHPKKGHPLVRLWLSQDIAPGVDYLDNYMDFNILAGGAKNFEEHKKFWSGMEKRRNCTIRHYYNISEKYVTVNKIGYVSIL